MQTAVKCHRRRVECSACRGGKFGQQKSGTEAYPAELGFFNMAEEDQSPQMFWSITLHNNRKCAGTSTGLYPSILTSTKS